MEDEGPMQLCDSMNHGIANLFQRLPSKGGLDR